ncbi:FecR domain-containing protein [Bdellovibrio bacteriovorus]
MKNQILSWCVFGVLSFQVTAFADDMYGVFMVTKGSVKVQSAKTGTTDAKVGVKVFEGDTVITAADSRAKIVMADRNVINVNPDTKIQIAKYQNDSATGKKDVQLNLLQGKVRNNVQQNYDGEKSKFLIKTPTAVAGVRGTQFLAGFDPSTQMTSVVTFKGAVSVAAVNKAGQVVGAPVMVKKGEMTTATANAAPEAPKPLPKEDVKKMDVESASTSQTKEGGEKASNEAAPAGDNKTAENKSPEGKENSKRDPANEGGAPAADAGGTKSAQGEAPPPMKEAAPPMIDKKDMDIGMAKEINDVRQQPVAAPTTTMPRAPTADTTSPVKDIIRDSMGKTRVIVRPQIGN